MVVVVALSNDIMDLNGLLLLTGLSDVSIDLVFCGRPIRNVNKTKEGFVYFEIIEWKIYQKANNGNGPKCALNHNLNGC